MKLKHIDNIEKKYWESELHWFYKNKQYAKTDYPTKLDVAIRLGKKEHINHFIEHLQFTDIADVFPRTLLRAAANPIAAEEGEYRYLLSNLCNKLLECGYDFDTETLLLLAHPLNNQLAKSVLNRSIKISMEQKRALALRAHQEENIDLVIELILRHDVNEFRFIAGEFRGIIIQTLDLLRRVIETEKYTIYDSEGKNILYYFAHNGQGLLSNMVELIGCRSVDLLFNIPVTRWGSTFIKEAIYQIARDPEANPGAHVVVRTPFVFAPHNRQLIFDVLLELKNIRFDLLGHDQLLYELLSFQREDIMTNMLEALIDKFGIQIFNDSAMDQLKLLNGTYRVVVFDAIMDCKDFSDINMIDSDRLFIYFNHQIIANIGHMIDLMANKFGKSCLKHILNIFNSDLIRRLPGNNDTPDHLDGEEEHAILVSMLKLNPSGSDLSPSNSRMLDRLFDCSIDYVCDMIKHISDAFGTSDASQLIADALIYSKHRTLQESKLQIFNSILGHNAELLKYSSLFRDLVRYQPADQIVYMINAALEVPSISADVEGLRSIAYVCTGNWLELDHDQRLAILDQVLKVNQDQTVLADSGFFYLLLPFQSLLGREYKECVISKIKEKFGDINLSTMTMPQDSVESAQNTEQQNEITISTCIGDNVQL